MRVLIVVLFCCCLAACHTGRKVICDVPADYPEDMRREAFSLFEKGKVLYRQNCSSCHGIFTRGKKSIPDFSKVQIDNYSARFLKGDPVAHATAMKMSYDQFNQVVVFLRFRKQAPAARPRAAVN